jgi:DUF4097 and DUF4098 domain-containing protein YvlB
MTLNMSTRAGFGLLCVLCLGAAFAPSAHATQYQKSYVVSGRASVRVLASNGAVRVTTSDANRVEFIVTYDRGIGSSDLPVDSRQDGMVVELRALTKAHSSWWNWSYFENAHLSIEVRMPKNADLQIDTSNGAVSLDTIRGTVKVHTSNAAINASGLEGRCALATTNGRVDVSGRFQSLDLSSTNAGVTARAVSGSSMDSGWSISTTNGGINLSIPLDLKANLSAGTTNGGIMLQLPVAVAGEQRGSHLRGTLGGGGPELFVRTTNAGVRLDES